MNIARRCSGSESERGSMSAFVVAMVFALVMCGGLVVDGGRMVMTRASAGDHAENAARAGAQEVELVGGHRRLNRGRAASAARAYLSSQGQRGSVSVSADRVVVTVTASTSMTVLSLIGVGAKRVNVTRTSEPVDQ